MTRGGSRNLGKKFGPHSQEWRDNHSNMMKGISTWNKGLKLTIQHRKNLSIAKIGNKNRLGIPHSKRTKEKISKSLTGIPQPFNQKPMKEETKKKISDSLTGREFSINHRKKLSIASKRMCKNPKEIERRKIRRRDQVFPFKDSKPERMMQIALALNGIKFIKHKPFKLGNSWHQVDIFIEPNVCLEVDGVYWHTKNKEMKRDLFQSQELTIMGYHVIRIRDKDILNNTQNCAETVLRLINELKGVDLLW